MARVPRAGGRRLFVLAIVAALGSPTVASGRGAPGPLTGVDALNRAYDEILDARFAAAERRLAACESAPPVACAVLDAARLWWQIQMDPHSRAKDAVFSTRVDEAIAAAEAWTRREPNSAEAGFYLGGAYGARAQWRVLRVERLAAARDGKQIKTALERALRLDPTLEDANFGIGLYQYYADVAPAVAKFLRWLLLLPGGDRKAGLARMLRARERGQLLQGEADYQLHVIYLWYEQDFRTAVDLLGALARRYPGNPIFPLQAADIHDVYFHDPTASRRGYEVVLALARQHRVNEATLAETRARLGLAAQLDTLYESDRALEHARAVIAIRPAAYGALAEAWLYAGRAQARLGEGREAEAAYAQALSHVPPGDALEVRRRVRDARQVRVDPAAARAYRVSLEGWRAYERGNLAGARATLERALAMRPEDMVARARFARVLAAAGDRAGAFRELEIVTGAGATTPPTFFADACVDLGSMLEARGDRSRALVMYQRAAQTFGAFEDTRSQARRDAARLRGSPGDR